MNDALARLAGHLRTQGTTRFMLKMRDLFPEEHLKDLIAEEIDGRRIRIQGRMLYNFGSDSFLGLDQDPRVQEAIREGVRTWGTHNGASRAFHSVLASREAEERLARWLGVEATLIFPTVTLANMGLLPGLVRRGDLLAVDRMAHNSIQEGAKIARDNGARLEQIWPCTREQLREVFERAPYEGCVVAVDGVYSMTGESPPLLELDQITRAHGGVLYIDDAHGTGIFGENGRGTAFRELGRLDRVLLVGSLSKAFSCMGAFVTCTEELKLLLKMISSTYIFGGPVPPPYLEGIIAACDILSSPEYELIIGRLRQRVERLVSGARALGYVVLGGQSPIVSLLLKDKERTIRAGKWLFDRGYFVQSVIFPAVPANGAVLRIQVNANHPTEAIEGLLEALHDLWRVMPPAARKVRRSVA